EQAQRHRRDAGRPRLRPAHGPAGLRRRRLRQDGGGAARRLHDGDERQAGGRGGADDAARPPTPPRFCGALPRAADSGGAGLTLRARSRAEEGQGGAGRRHRRHRGRHPRAARQGDQVPRSRPHHRRRGAAFRRVPQGAPEGAARRGPRPDPLGDADPAHPATRAYRRARALDHRDAPGRPSRGAHLRHALRPAPHPRGAAARALPRRPGLLRRAAHRGHRRGQDFPRPRDAGGQGRGRPRSDGRGPARGRDDRVLRRKIRHPALDHDHRIGPRHPDRQHPHRASRRHVRSLATLPVARPGWALENPRLCLVHRAGEPATDRPGGAPAQGAAVAGHLRRRLPTRLARPRHPRRRQPFGAGAVRPHQGGWLRALSADAGGGGLGPQGGGRGAGGRAVVADHRDRDAGDDPRALRRGPDAPPRPLPPPLHARNRPGDRRFWGRDDRPVRPAALGSRAASEDHGHQGAVPARQCRQGRGRAEGRHRIVSRQRLREPGGARLLRGRAGLLREGAAGHAGRVHPRCRGPRRAPEGHDLDPAQPRAGGGVQAGGV
ncbi:MAG: Transcription-repair coupling factor, partial [uncultured Microvirga sp.]